MPSLTVYLNGASPSVYQLDTPVANVGRNADNEISIDENHVSSVHARLKREPGGDYRITDLESSNGSSLNGKPLGDAVLHHGDRITFGVYVRALYQNKVIESSPSPDAPKPSPKPATSSNRPAAIIFVNLLLIRRWSSARSPGQMAI
jgi:pSer/pThr/pTyr-binding forkhead associated (FHA) protein